MAKIVIGAVALVVGLTVLRRFGPALRERGLKKCHDVFARLPEDFPPKRMMRSIEEIREQNTRILRQLKQLQKLAESASAD